MTLAPWYTDQEYPDRLMLVAADLSTGGTHAPVDCARAAMILRGSGMHPAVLRMILDKRAAWLDWHAATQRRWQRETRRPSRARHHDSIGIREGYVRCHDGEPRVGPYR